MPWWLMPVRIDFDFSSPYFSIKQLHLGPW
jgi:hypothetical protein